MHTEMSQKTRQEVLARLRHFYKSAGRPHKSKLLQEAIALLGYHPKSAIRALNAKPRPPWTLKSARDHRATAGVFAGQAPADSQADLVCRFAALRASFACAPAGVAARL
jgi:hypothetical protein